MRSWVALGGFRLDTRFPTLGHMTSFVGALTQAELDAHLTGANPGPRVGTFVTGNAFGVAADTCQRPTSTP